MRLINYISEEHIVPELRGTTKEDVLAELSAILLRGRRHIDKKAALEKILAREAIESTGIGASVAVPHASIPGLKQLFCAVGRTDRGLDFASIDKKPVELVFLVCFPPDQPTVYLNFLATLACTLRAAGAVEALTKAKTASEILQVIELHAKPFISPENQVSGQQGAAVSDESAGGTPACSEIVLLARLELCVDMLESAEDGQDEIRRRVENIEARINPDALRRFEQFRKRNRRAVVAIEGAACQGCFMKIPPQLIGELHADHSSLHHCPHCQRFIFLA